MHCFKTWLQPHMHMNLPPICFARSVCCAAMGEITNGAGAKAPTTRSRARSRRGLVMTFLQGGRRAERPPKHRTSCGLLGPGEDQHSAPIRKKRHESAADDDHAAKPDPLYERIQICMDYRQTCIRALARIDDVKVIPQRRVNRNHRA